MIRPVIYPIGPSIAYIELTRGMFALVDWDDARLLGQFNWHITCGNGKKSKTFYASNVLAQKHRLMHKVLMKAPKGVLIDHKNGNGLDCRRSNLRHSNHSQNLFNAGGHVDAAIPFKGVHMVRLSTGIKYQAHICCKGKRFNLGNFLTPEAAHEAYKAKAKELHGEFARFA